VSLRAIELCRSQASEAGLATHVVNDAGRTQVAAGSATVLAIGNIAYHIPCTWSGRLMDDVVVRFICLGPAEIPIIDGVTGHLQLL
jgi:peptidyl-tRNA hydrolase